MRRLILLAVLGTLVGCGPSERDLEVARSPLSNEYRDPRPKIPSDEELKQMPLEDVQAILDNDRSKEAWEALNKKEMQIAEEKLDDATLEELTERLKADPNDRVALKMYVLKVEKIARDSLEKDPEKSWDVIQEGVEFYIAQAKKLKPDLGLKFYRMSQERWNPISEKAEAIIFADDYVPPSQSKEEDEQDEESSE